ncbi:hypothetical protein FVE85_0792 [Porphyridium purpureum]|uniref:Uncharacterized protein n=1 Tax=Porphyridium purpureum TaxID=35688 RepID=A0A5J4Z2C5_PORPP|nr:hypothetical protein FVE85_0792 [Porphyridium purpureum]|eukprot:POR5476..scf208_2
MINALDEFCLPGERKHVGRAAPKEPFVGSGQHPLTVRDSTLRRAPPTGQNQPWPVPVRSTLELTTVGSDRQPSRDVTLPSGDSDIHDTVSAVVQRSMPTATPSSDSVPYQPFRDNGPSTSLPFSPESLRLGSRTKEQRQGTMAMGGFAEDFDSNVMRTPAAVPLHASQSRYETDATGASCADPRRYLSLEQPCAGSSSLDGHENVDWGAWPPSEMHDFILAPPLNHVDAESALAGPPVPSIVLQPVLGTWNPGYDDEAEAGHSRPNVLPQMNASLESKDSRTGESETESSLAGLARVEAAKLPRSGISDEAPQLDDDRTRRLPKFQAGVKTVGLYEPPREESEAPFVRLGGQKERGKLTQDEPRGWGLPAAVPVLKVAKRPLMERHFRSPEVKRLEQKALMFIEQ